MADTQPANSDATDALGVAPAILEAAAEPATIDPLDDFRPPPEEQRGAGATVATMLWFVGLGLIAVGLSDGNLQGIEAIVSAPVQSDDAIASTGAPTEIALAEAVRVRALDGESEQDRASPRPTSDAPASSPSASTAAALAGPLAPRRLTGAPFGSTSGAAVEPIDDPCIAAGAGGCAAHAMDSFYRALRRVERGQPGAKARVLHFGDSIVAVEGISGRLRETLQARFGDGGAGYVYIAPPSRWYLREGVKHDASGWQVRSVVSNPWADHLFGLGAASFVATGEATATASFATLKPGHSGDRASHYEIAFLEQPTGGTVEVELDGQPQLDLDTRGDAVRSAWRRVDTVEGAHRLQVRSKSGTVRLFGVSIENDAPGVVYDSLGLISSSARALASVDAVHFREQLAHRGGDLLMVFLGTNEADWLTNGNAVSQAYQAQFGRVLSLLRGGAPEASCLVMSPLDAGVARDGVVISKPPLPMIVEAQRRAARAAGCAFWDSFHWMGGAGAMIKWYDRGLVASDYTHPSRAGANRVGDALLQALMAGYHGVPMPAPSETASPSPFASPNSSTYASPYPSPSTLSDPSGTSKLAEQNERAGAAAVTATAREAP